MLYKRTDEEKYAELLKGIGELLAEKNGELSMKDFEIESLKEKLAECEKKIADLEAKERGEWS